MKPEEVSVCPVGGKNEAFAKYFTGQSYLNMLTTGRGYYQEWGKEAQELHPGSVVVIPAEVKHWHGAAPDSWFGKDSERPALVG